MNLEDIYRLLRSDHVQVQGIVDTLYTPLLVVDQNHAVVNANAAFFATFKVNRAETISKSIFDLGNGQWNNAELRRLLLEIIPKSQAIVGYEVTYDFPDLGQRTMRLDARKLVHPDNNSRQYLVLFDDVTESNRVRSDQDILLQETRHRMRNLLGVVRAVATQTEVMGRSAEEYRDVFLGRLAAIIQAEDNLVREVDLSRLLTDALGSVAEGRGVIEGGPSVQLNDRQTMSLGMIIHELVTNAMKYGALSGPDGVVRVRWAVEHGVERPKLRLDWIEENGPPVLPPSRTGFGTRLIHYTASHSLGGDAQLAFDPAGLTARVTVPL